MSQLPDYAAQFLVIGCYTPEAPNGGSGVGLSVARRNPETGALSLVGPATPTPAPSYVTRHPTLPVAYAVNELAGEGQVSAFAVAEDGRLTPLGSWPTDGSEPCHVTVSPTGRHLLVANYGTGSVATFTLDADGRPQGRASLVEHKGGGPHPERQTGPHTHNVAVTDDGVLAVDLGVDTVFRYPLDPATGDLGPGEVAAKLPPGTGPRHFATAGDQLYLVGELTATVTVFRTDGPAWREAGTVRTTTATESLPSEIATSADGRFLYVGNRGPDTIAIFALGGDLPVLVGEVPTGGSSPRHFVLAEPFLYVANQLSDTVVVFRIDPATGLPSPTGDVLPTPSPTCVLIWN